MLRMMCVLQAVNEVTAFLFSFIHCVHSKGIVLCVHWVVYKFSLYLVLLCCFKSAIGAGYRKNLQRITGIFLQWDSLRTLDR